MKLGAGKSARAVPYSGAWIGMRDSGGFMCCYCGDSYPEVLPECRSCGATLTFSEDPVTDVEKRDIQIAHLKGCIASNWDFKGALLKHIVALEAGEKPEWPEAYGKGARQWLDNNGWSKGTKGHEIAAVTESWEAYGRGGEGSPQFPAVAWDDERWIDITHLAHLASGFEEQVTPSGKYRHRPLSVSRTEVGGGIVSAGEWRPGRAPK